MYYTYMLRCEDNSIYTGFASDVNKRMQEHFSKDEKCAKYTLRHSAKKLECVFESDTRSLATKLEYWIKKLPKKSKEDLIKNPSSLEMLLGEKIDSYEYRIYDEDLGY